MHLLPFRCSLGVTFPCTIARLAAVSTLALAGGLLCACTTTLGQVQVALPPEPMEDAAYAPVLGKWHSKVQIIDQFQKVIDAEAVLFSDEMRKAYAERWVRIRGEREAEIDSLAGGKLAVFVSVFTPEDDYLKLDDKQLWTLGLRLGAQGASPSLIRKLSTKSAFLPFFPFVNKWTSDYIVVFDASSSGLGNQALVNPSSATFTMRSALASVEFTWK